MEHQLARFQGQQALYFHGGSRPGPFYDGTGGDRSTLFYTGHELAAFVATAAGLGDADARPHGGNRLADGEVRP